MSTAAAARRPLPPAGHDDETLLGLTESVARKAEHRGEATPAAAVSVRVFSRLRVDVDRARGVDPAGPDRTPTANAIVMHFRARAIRPVASRDVVAAALALPQRQQWLVVTRRSEQTNWLTVALVWPARSSRSRRPSGNG